MLILGLALALAVASVACFPCWPYSARWGYVPSLTAGILLLFVALLAVDGKQVSRAIGQMANGQVPHVVDAPRAPSAQAQSLVLDASRQPVHRNANAPDVDPETDIQLRASGDRVQ